MFAAVIEQLGRIGGVARDRIDGQVGRNAQRLGKIMVIRQRSAYGKPFDEVIHPVADADRGIQAALVNTRLCLFEHVGDRGFAPCALVAVHDRTAGIIGDDAAVGDARRREGRGFVDVEHQVAVTAPHVHAAVAVGDDLRLAHLPRERNIDLGERDDVEIEVGAEVILVAARVGGRIAEPEVVGEALLVGIPHRGEEGHLFGTTGDIDAVLLLGRHPGVENPLHVVRTAVIDGGTVEQRLFLFGRKVSHRLDLGGRIVAVMPEFPQFVLRKYLDVVGLAVVGERLVAQHGIIVGVDQAGQGRRGGEADIGRERNFQVAFAAAFGRHDDDAVGTAHAVHGRRRSILEHVDVLHIVRVEHVEGRHVAHDAVDDDQRVLVAGIRPHAAHADRGLFEAGLAGLLDGGHTGDTPNEGIGNIGHGGAHQLLARQLPDGAGDGLLLLGAEADHHHIVDALDILLEHDADIGLSSYGHLPGGIADK